MIMSKRRELYLLDERRVDLLAVKDYLSKMEN